MKRPAIFILACFLISAGPASPTPHWSGAQVARLVEWLVSAEKDGLAPVASQAETVREALSKGDAATIDRVATTAAIRLLAAHRQGCCNASLRTGWHIAGESARPDPASAVAAAINDNRIDALFATARPSHPFYLGLREDFAKQSDSAKRATILANLDRWRWMPRDPGSRYLLVNTAAFEASLWDSGKMVGRWAVIVGKTRSPTPVFQAQVTGVTFNPWWEIPSSIAAEGIAAMIARRPREAASKGYVRQNGRYRQRPGPTNALGRMKLVMPNPYNVYLHDTPAQSLFAQDVRAYSHGCIRVGDALGLVTALLAGPAGWDRAKVDATVASGKTQTFALSTPIPVYITYFTAEPDDTGAIRYFPDIYRRDVGASAPSQDETCPK